MPVLSRAHKGHSASREQARTRICDATVELLNDVGTSFAEIAVEQILERAGVSRATFYAHFSDKRELLLTLATERVATLLERVDLSDGGLPSGPDGVRESLTVAIKLVRTYPGLFRAVMEASMYDPGVAEFVQAVDRQFIERIADRIREQQKLGNAMKGDPKRLAAPLVWMCQRAAYEHIRRPDGATDRQLAKTLGDIWVRAIYGE